MHLNHSSKPLQVAVWFIAYSFFISLVAPFAAAGGSRSIFGNRWLSNAAQGQRNAPQPRPGAPEGIFPNLDELRRRIPPIPRAPLPVPSTIRSKHNPLLPWDGRRVGDPLPLRGQGVSDKVPSTSDRLPRHAVRAASHIQSRGLTARQGSKAGGARLHHARIAASSVSPPPLLDDQYVQNFSYWALLRYPEGIEATYWNDIYRTAYANGQPSLVLATRELGKALFESSEYAARGRDNHWYVYDLYKTFLMRDPDAAGWAFWESVVPGSGRENVRRAFEDCTELSDLMSTVTPNGSISSAVSSLLSARVDPINQPGNGMLARDATWGVTLLSLPGRSGLDLGLALSYSSMVWTRSGPYLYFDEDNGFPSPGFRLGFPTVQRPLLDAQVGKNTYLLITPAGRRVELRQVGATNTYEAADSSYLQLIDNGNSWLVRSTDGTQLSYSEFNNEYRCTQIKDRNGNYLTVNYDGWGHITTITDTLERVITFNYDGNANLLSITQTWNGQTHTWATFGWGTRTMQSSFSDVSVVGAPNGTAMPVITQVGLDDGSYFTFDYTNSLQASVIRRYSFDAIQRAYTAYNYDAPAGDCPRLIDSRVWASNWTGINGVPAEVITQYSVDGGACVMTAPDGTIYKEFYGTGWQKGLTTLSEVWSGGVRQKWGTTAWSQDNTAVNYQLNPRPTETNVYDAAGNRRRTTIDYQGSFGLPWIVAEYAADALTVLRRTYFDYKNDSAYIDRRIIGLLFRRTVYDGNWNLMAKTEYGYDWDWFGDMFQDTPAPATQHDRTNYGPGFIYGRGNLSQMARFDVNDPNNTSNTWQETKWRVNSTGSLLMERDHLWHQSFASYGDSFSDSNNSRNTFAYPTTVTDADGNSTSIQYNFDFGAKTRVQGPPPAGQSQGLIQTFTYDGAARVDRVTTTNNGAYQRFWYGPDYVGSLASVNNVADEAYTNRVFDGLGRLIGVATNHPGSSGGYKAELTQYDVMGRVMKQSNPSEITGYWVPTGDDAAGWLHTEQSYDWQGRPLITTNTDWTTKEASYGGCGCAGGSVVTLTDEGTSSGGVAKKRQQKIYSDVLGRTWKTEVLNWDGAGPSGTGGTVYSATVNTYNARDQITQVRQYAGPEGSGTYQDTVITYDGRGRLKTRHAPEQDAGAVTTWDYNSDDTVQKVTDGRNATQTFTYNNRHQVTGISYGVPYESDIPVPGAVSISYDDAGNRTSMYDGSGSVSYQYNQLSQMTSETRTFSGLGGSYPISYEYNLAGELKKITDPTNVTINYNYDTAGRATDITGENVLYGGVSQYASGMTYRAWGGTKGLTYGNNYTLAVSYDARLQGTQFEIAGRPSQFGPATVMKTQYQYYADGRLKFAGDLLDERFDRAYSYDQAARLKEGYSGSEARDYVNGTSGSPWSGPYRQTYQHDAFGNLTQRDNRFWSHNDTFTASYTNHRRQGFQYDADGRLKQDDDLQYHYDAGGTIRFIFDASINKWLTLVHDTDGRQVKRVETINTPVATVYFLRSSVLGGRIITELNESGQKRKGYVFAGSQLLAEQENSVVNWKLENPLTGSRGDAAENGFFSPMAEPDPMGVNLGFTDPFAEPFFEPPAEEFVPRLLGDSGSCGLNPNCTTCYLDGFEIGCDRAMHLLDIGAADLQVTLNNGRRLTVPVQSFGLGIFRVWIPHHDPRGPGYGSDSGDVIRTNTFQDDLLGHWETFSFNFTPGQGGMPRRDSTPQNPVPQTAPPGNLAQNVANLLTGDCGEFVKSLYAKVAGMNPQQQAHSQTFNLLDVFNTVNNRSGGVVFQPVTVGGRPAGGTVSGAIGDSAHPPTIHISPITYFNVLPDAGRRYAQYSYAMVAVHESFHLAGRGGYSDQQMAQAVFGLTGAPGLPGKGSTAWDYSGYWNGVLKSKCPEKRR